MSELEKKRVLWHCIGIIAAGIVFGITFIVLLLFVAKPAHAINNPADMTSSYGQIPVEFYKICYDAGGSRWFDFGFPMGDKTSNLYFDNWISKDGENKNFGVQVSKRFPKLVSFTFVNNLSYGNGNSDSSQAAWLDLRWEGGGASILLPFEPGGDPTFGLRSDKGPLYGYLQYDPSDKSFFSGVSYEFRKSGVSLDLAYSEASEVTFVRLSKSVQIDSGTLIPEIRTKLGDTDYIGFGLGFVPN